MNRLGTCINAGCVLGSSNNFEPGQQQFSRPRQHGAMIPRTDFATASRVDLTLILLPLITFQEASLMLAISCVPAEVAARVLTLPDARRSTCQTGQVGDLGWSAAR